MSRSALNREAMYGGFGAHARQGAPLTVVHGILPGVANPYAQQPSYGGEDDDGTEANKVPMIENINTKNYNINPLLCDRIYTSEFFRKLYEYKTYHEVIDVIYENVYHVEPWELGQARNPSPCFCLLLKCCTMRLTRRQLNGLLDHKDSVFIRAMGFLYLRFTLPPKLLFDYYEPYFDDPEPIQPGGDPSTKTTVGEWIKTLLSGNKYFNTILPRIPVPVERQYKMDLLKLEKDKEEERARTRKNERNRHLFACGTKVTALFHEDKKWYQAVIDSIEKNGKFWVTFTEYGNSEEVSLGNMKLVDEPDDRDRRSRSRDRHKDDDRFDRGRDKNSSQDLMEEVLRREREGAECNGRMHRPTSLKGSLSLAMDKNTIRKRSPTPTASWVRGSARKSRSRSRDRGRGVVKRGGRDRDRDRDRGRDRDRDRGRDRDRRDRDRDRDRRDRDRDRGRDRGRDSRSPDGGGGSRRREYDAKLLSKYGDASSKRE